eukprot:Gb_15135 [translate_table: standard]
MEYIINEDDNGNLDKEQDEEVVLKDKQLDEEYKNYGKENNSKYEEEEENDKDDKSINKESKVEKYEVEEAREEELMENEHLKEWDKYHELWVSEDEFPKLDPLDEEEELEEQPDEDYPPDKEEEPMEINNVTIPVDTTELDLQIGDMQDVTLGCDKISIQPNEEINGSMKPKMDPSPFVSTEENWSLARKNKNNQILTCLDLRSQPISKTLRKRIVLWKLDGECKNKEEKNIVENSLVTEEHEQQEEESQQNEDWEYIKRAIPWDECREPQQVISGG